MSRPGDFATLLILALGAPSAHGQERKGAGALQAEASLASSSGDDWHFIVSGDSRNCGDLVMPAIAADAAKYHPAFYWHLGDLRAIYEMDEDYAGELNANSTLNAWDMETYTRGAWDDFIRVQIEPFETLQIPLVIGIGNHETIAPMSREKFIEKFSPWLDSSVLRDQRLKDAGHLSRAKRRRRSMPTIVGSRMALTSSISTMRATSNSTRRRGRG